LAIFLAASVRSSSVHELFPPDCCPVDHGLEGRSAATYFALMRAFVGLVMQPFIQIDRTPEDETKTPSLRNSLEVRAWL
jgi:hypothetical protein